MDTPFSDRKTEILRAASNLFIIQGYHATSLSAVASAVGLLKGSLYHHIDSKEDLLTEIIVDAIASAEANLIGTVKLGGGVEKILTSHLRYLSSNPGLAVLLREAVRLPRLRRNMISRRLESYEDHLGEIIETGQRNRLIADGDRQFIVRLLIVASTQPLWNELGMPSFSPSSDSLARLLFAVSRDEAVRRQDTAYQTPPAMQRNAAVA